jgi:hypothetical protein
LNPLDPATWRPDQLALTLRLPLVELGVWLMLVALVGFTRAILPERPWRAVSLLCSWGFMAWILGPPLLLFLLATASMLHGICDLETKRSRGWAFFVVLGLVYLPASMSTTVLSTPLAGLDHTDRVAAWMLAIFGKRAVYWAWAHVVANAPKPTLWDSASYFLALPFALGKAAVVSPGEWRKTETNRAPVPKALTQGGRTLGLALIHLALFHLLLNTAQPLVVSRRVLTDTAEMGWGTLYALVLVNWVGIYLLRYGMDQLSVGAARAMGQNVRDNYENPLMSRDYADFWRRWNVHFREMMVRMFYMPSVLHLCRRDPGKRVRNLWAGIALTFFMHGLFMAWLSAITVSLWEGGLWRDIALGLMLYEVAETVLVGLTLTRNHLRGASRAAPHPAWVAGGVVLTFHLRAILVLLLLKRQTTLTSVFDTLQQLVCFGACQ